MMRPNCSHRAEAGCDGETHETLPPRPPIERDVHLQGGETLTYDESSAGTNIRLSFPDGDDPSGKIKVLIAGMEDFLDDEDPAGAGQHD